MAARALLRNPVALLALIHEVRSAASQLEELASSPTLDRVALQKAAYRFALRLIQLLRAMRLAAAEGKDARKQPNDIIEAFSRASAEIIKEEGEKFLERLAVDAKRLAHAPGEQLMGRPLYTDEELRQLAISLVSKVSALLDDLELNMTEVQEDGGISELSAAILACWKLGLGPRGAAAIIYLSLLNYLIEGILALPDEHALEERLQALALRHAGAEHLALRAAASAVPRVCATLRRLMAPPPDDVESLRRALMTLL